MRREPFENAETLLLKHRFVEELREKGKTARWSLWIHLRDKSKHVIFEIDSGWVDADDMRRIREVILS